jgi:hypothetical protein
MIYAGLAAMAAVAAALVALAFLGVREQPYRASSFLSVAGSAWIVLLVTIGLAALLARRSRT